MQLVSNDQIKQVFEEILDLPIVREHIAKALPAPRLYRISRAASRGDPRGYRGFARYNNGEISLTLGALCEEGVVATLALHEVAHIVSPDHGHGLGFKMTFCRIVQQMYGINLFAAASERYHVLDAIAAKAIGLYLSESFGEEEPSEFSPAWWKIGKVGRRKFPRYLSRSEAKEEEILEQARAEVDARRAAAVIRNDRRKAAATGRIQ